MVGRQPNTASWNNGSSTSGSRRGRPSLERDGETSSTRGVERSSTNGQSAQQLSQQIDEGSDVDELIDSDTERAEMDKLAKSKTVARSTPTGGGKGAGRSRSKGGTSAATSSNAGSKASPSIPNLTEGQDDSMAIDTAYPSSTKKPPTPQPREQSSKPITKQAIDPLSFSTSKGPLTLVDIRGREGPAELGQFKSGGNAGPYYHPHHSLDFKTKSQSPRDGQLKKSAPPFSASHISSKADAGSMSLAASSEDLNLQEVDKFLDLIEKHNLHTSNEDDMARSVTELYQEWLEWCAKRSVVSTKSKQALVAEFVRIHQGDYGRTRQQRAMEIVKGSAGQEGGDIGSGMNRPAFELAIQPIPTFPPLAKSAPSSRNVSRFKEEDRGDSQQQVIQHAKSLSSSTGLKRVASGGPPGHYIHVPSPSLAPRAMTPGPNPASYNDGYAAASSSSDALYRRIREDVWRDASVMIGQVVHEQMAEVLEENSALRGRVEQLEIHSDNLAQWIQHLNRVQDELSLSIRSAGLPPPPPPPPPQLQPPMRDDIMVDKQSAKYSNHGHRAMGPNHHDRNFVPPTYHGGSSPKRSYSARRSPSPPLMSRSTRRPIDSPQKSHGQTLYQSRGDTRNFHSGGSHGGGHSRIPLSDPYDRPYYAYSPDVPPPPLPSHSPHQSKRARNGY